MSGAPAARPPSDWRDAPFRDADFLPVDLDLLRDPDGTIRLKSRFPPTVLDANLARAFFGRAKERGDHPALAERADDGRWAVTSYDELARQVESISQWLLDSVPRGSVVIVMAENSVAVAALTFAAFATGTILCPVSPAYGHAGGDHARLRHVIARTRPTAIFADPVPAFARAIAEAADGPITVLSAKAELFAGKTVAWGRVIETAPRGDVQEAIGTIDPDAVALYMMTSGSTGLPKVVQLSLSALAANCAQGLDMIGRAAGWNETMLDWLPWHHAAGASVLRTALTEGGTLYIDGGKPAPGLFERSIMNLREISVSYFNNVPSGYAMLIDAMDKDPELRRSFFKKMRLMLYGGAGLPQHVYDRLQAQAVAETGHRIHMTTGYGMTEMVSGCLAIHFPTEKVGIGLPGPGLEVKLVPNGVRYEVRLRGPNMMKGYLDEPAKTAEAFDDEGYYRTGDMALFHDPDRPEQGLAFAGRLAEEFKLANGTWVYGGTVREALLKALTPLVGEVVLAAENRPYLGLLFWPKPGAPDDVVDQVAERLHAFNASQQGGSARIRRVAALGSPPSVDAHEISDKGTINRRAVLDHRVDAVEALFAEPPGPGVRVI